MTCYRAQLCQTLLNGLQTSLRPSCPEVAAALGLKLTHLSVLSEAFHGNYGLLLLFSMGCH